MFVQRPTVRRFLTPFALFLFVTLGTTYANAQQATPQRSLYERLGGYDAVAAVVDDFIARLASDPQLQKFLVGLSTDSKKKLRQHVLNQFCQATGGPCVYTGRDMKTSHAGLGITEKEWDAGAKHLVAALDKFKVPEREKGEVVAFVSSLKKDIVEK